MNAALRKAIRPLIPDAVMARYRRHQHSRAVRRNVDVHVTGDRSARRWRAYTPDTYRVITVRPPGGEPPEPIVAMGAEDPDLVSYLGFHGAEAVVRGRVAPPSMRAMRIVEPTVDPISIVTTHDVLDAANVPAGADLPTVLRLLADAGTRLALVPVIARGPVEARLPAVGEEAVAVFAAVPLHDIGGGSRAAQIAFELVRRGYHVTYVYRFPSSEGVDLGLRYPHPRLEEYHLDTFDVDDVLRRAGPGTVVIEAPIGEFVPPVERLRAAEWGVLYDVIDDWTDEALGGMWYAPVFERRIIDLADAYSASAPDLVERIRRFGHDAALVPNAVNAEVFGPGIDEVPEDLPSGPLLGYHGSLYGDWFDWEALRSVALAHPGHTVVVIGDDRGVPGDLPDNVVFLGLKAQGDLAAYLRRFDAGLVPFRVTDVTHAVSPLKVYEYLACGVPVAAPPLRALEGVEGVATDTDLVAAVDAALARPRPDPGRALAAHSWGARLEAMFDALGRDIQPAAGPGITPRRRPPIRYAKADRWIRE